MRKFLRKLFGTPRPEDAFPCSMMITQEIIDKSNVKRVFHCIGANTLKQIYNPKTYPPTWGSTKGHIYVNRFPYSITVFSDHDMTRIKVPTMVKLSLEPLKEVLYCPDPEQDPIEAQDYMP